MTAKFDVKCLTQGNKTLCHVDGKYIKSGDGSTGGLNFIMCRVEGKFMIKISDATKAIGSKFENALTAAMWYLFFR